jgi:hypothetical protein
MALLLEEKLSEQAENNGLRRAIRAKASFAKIIWEYGTFWKNVFPISIKERDTSLPQRYISCSF